MYLKKLQMVSIVDHRRGQGGQFSPTEKQQKFKVFK